MADDVTRRELVRRAALFTVLPTVAGAVVSSGCARLLSAERRIDAPAPDRKGNVALAHSLAPELAVAGGGVVLHFPPASGRRPALIVNTGSGMLGMQADCPHESCDLTWVQGDREAECPCHGSRFASDGTVLNPPAVSNLETYLVDQTPDAFTVHLSPGDGVYPAPADDGTLTLSLKNYPALQQVSGSVVGRPEGSPGPLLLVRVDATTIAALSALCPHLGCVVQRRSTDFHCPCHGSTFHLDGSFVPQSGPALSALSSFPVTKFDPAAGALVVQLS